MISVTVKTRKTQGKAFRRKRTNTKRKSIEIVLFFVWEEIESIERVDHGLG